MKVSQREHNWHIFQYYTAQKKKSIMFYFDSIMYMIYINIPHLKGQS